MINLLLSLGATAIYETRNQKMAVDLCLKLSCQDLKAIVKSDRSQSPLHFFSGKTAPASMLAVDLRLQKTMEVTYCSKQFCIEKQNKKNEMRKQNALKNGMTPDLISLKKIKADCKQCDGKQPKNDCNTEENKEKPGCKSSCQCFKYKVTKVCEIYDGKKGKECKLQLAACEIYDGKKGK